MKSINPLHHIAQYSTISPVKGESTSKATWPEPGKLLKATVLETRPDNSILLQIGDNHVTARSDMTMRPGQSLQLQLLTSSPRITFKVVDNTLQQFFNRPLTLIGQPIDIRSLFSLLDNAPSIFSRLRPEIRETLENVYSQQQQLLSGEIKNGSLLKQIVDNLGLTFEKILSRGDGPRAALTLKAALLDLATAAKDDSRVSENVARTLTTLEFFQLAQLHGNSSQQFILPLPFPFLEQGFLVVEKQDDTEGGSKGYEGQDYRFSLFVKMTPLGNLRVDFLHSKEGLLIRFHADTQDKADFLAAHGDDLRQTLTESPIQGVTFVSGAPDPNAELLSRLVPDGHSLFHTTI